MNDPKRQGAVSEISKNLDLELLARHDLTGEEFQRAGIAWDCLRDIAKAHRSAIQELKVDAEHIAQRLQAVPAIHSLKWRVKDPEHLIAKIIRKRLEPTPAEFSVDSYEALITDLIGVRALHLLKNQWRPIHEFVCTTWDLFEVPTAHIRKGDPSEVQDAFKAENLEVKEHDFGYRSVHYLIKFNVTKKQRIAELQVRTIFEEGWSELDHQVRYPRRSNDPTLNEFLAIFNRAAGSADEMGTFVVALEDYLVLQQREVEENKLRAQQAEERLQKIVQDLRISDEDKNRMKKEIEKLRAAATPPTSVYALPRATSAAFITGVPNTVFSSVLPSESALAPGFSACKACGQVSFTLVDGVCALCRAKSPFGAA